MASTTFIAKVTHILASWLNQVNTVCFKAVGDGIFPPTTPGEVRTNLGLPAILPPTGASLIGMTDIPGVGDNIQEFVDGLASPAGAGIVGFTGAGDLASSNLQDAIEELDNEKGSLLHGNVWTGEQFLEYTTPATGTGVDHGGWVSLIHNQDGGSTDNITALTGHGYHDGNFNNPSGIWGVVTEAWSNPTNYATLIGGEFAVISQCPVTANPSVGVNSVFKNRLDTATHPTAAVADGSEYNTDAVSLLITSQARPSGAGAAWAGVGSGWQTAIKIGDPVFGPGIDWEGGSFFPGSSTKKAYSTIIDMSDSLADLAGGFPWFALYRNSATYWGMRFNGLLTGALKTYNIVINNGGAGYADGDVGNITGGGGVGAKYFVVHQTAGVVDFVVVMGEGGAGYVAGAGAATVATTGGGAGLTLDITVGAGLIYGGNIGITAAGLGYFAGELVHLEGGTANYAKPVIKVLTIGGGGAAATIELQTGELEGTGAFTPHVNTIGRGHTAGAGKATTSITGGGAGLTIAIVAIHDDTLVGGEKWEFWRMLNPSNPTATGARHGFIDSSFPGTPITIDTSGATYTFPVDKPL